MGNCVVASIHKILEIFAEISNNNIKCESLEELHLKFIKEFNLISNGNLQEILDINQIDQIKYAFVVTLDELVMNSKLSYAIESRSNSLQIKQYATSKGGEIFYDNLMLLCKDLSENKVVVEVHYLCLIFGFYGKYKVLMREEREFLIHNIKSRLYSKTISFKSLSLKKTSINKVFSIDRKVYLALVISSVGFIYYCLNIKLVNAISMVGG